MSVIITNVSPMRGDHEKHEYVVSINNMPVIARFDHVRANGLAECLRRAADAVDATEKDPRP